MGTDFCKEMLDSAPAKAAREGLQVEFQVADAMDLPFADATFDVASISFGIRNVDDPVKCLKEMARVVSPAAAWWCSSSASPRASSAASSASTARWSCPTIGGLLTGNRAAYEYLPRTAAAFPAGEKFLALMDQAGAYNERVAHPLTFGTSYVYVGTVR